MSGNNVEPEKPYKISKKEKDEIAEWKKSVPQFIIDYKEKQK